TADAPWKEHSLDDGWDINIKQGEATDRLDNCLRKDTAHASLVETQFVPFESEQGRRNRASRDARNAIQFWQKASLVQAPQGPDVEQQGPVSPTREAKSHAPRHSAFFPIRGRL